MSAPLVSVVIPVREAARYLREALDSVLAQTLTDLEVIAVDDGSTDSSVAILRSVEDPRVRVIEQPREGLTATLRAACAEARGTFIARMDADDVALPDRLERQVARLERDPGLAACGGAVVMLDERGRRLSTIRYPTDDAAIKRRLARSNAFAHPAVTMRRDAYEAVGGYRLVNGEDYDLWLRLAERYRLANLAEPVLLYRHHAAQYSVGRVDEQAVGVLAAKYAARLRTRGEPDPLDGVHELTPDALARLGLTEDTVAEAQRAHRLRWGVLLEQLGSGGSDLVAASGADPTRVALARAQAALALGRRRSAVAAVMRAIASHPLAFPRELARAVRSRGSFEPA